MIPIEFEHKTLRTVVDLGMNIFEAQKERIMQLSALDEMRKTTLHQNKVMQNQRIKWHDKFIKENKFQPGD